MEGNGRKREEKMMKEHIKYDVHWYGNDTNGSKSVIYGIRYDMIHDIWYMKLQYMIHDTIHMIHETWNMIQHTWYMIYDTWYRYMIHHTWSPYIIHHTWYMIHTILHHTNHIPPYTLPTLLLINPYYFPYLRVANAAPPLHYAHILQLQYTLYI